MEIISGLTFLIIIIAIIIGITTVPIYIAKSRGITGRELTTITILSWAGLIIGITWIIALVLSLTYQPNNWIDKNKGKTNIDLDGLEKLYRLKKNGVLSQTEFNREKKRLMGQQEEKDISDDINRLKCLKKEGVLTQEEYDEQRKLLIETNI